MPCLSLKTCILAETQSQSKNKTSESWFTSGRARENPHHWYTSTERSSQAQSSTTISWVCVVLPRPSWSHLHLHHLEKVDLLQCPGIGLRPRQLQDANKNVPCLADSPQFARWWLSPFLSEEGSALLVGHWESRNTSHTAQQSKRTHCKAAGGGI